MKTILISALFLFFFTGIFAQYPIEKYPAIKYDTVNIKHGEDKRAEGFTGIARYKDYEIKFLGSQLSDSSNILLYHKGRVIKKIKLEVDIANIFLTSPIFIADIDGNGLLDFKIDMPNDGSGNAANYETKIYLFNKGSNRFDAFSFYDLFSNLERDIDHDGSYEIIGQVYHRYRGHAYYVFDLYSYRKGKLSNVSSKFSYPIAVQYLWEPTYIKTNKIPTKVLKKLSAKNPTYLTWYK
ncbi:hypothetical protein [Mucilaginibacter myungsuensis]|uniref:Uncharacterized protein n=1 Tax=Mucilaginibacter myungsuensis TaxID=649104 RepID=A0A929KZ74_9SPHI|nr:hypothetical protein [Mucilaginibacter myungsuensis]MBE9660376.1 hypothetical protein [Mucilaginibacter myungsuensis]MDN3600418.1 hypothetical protein [Mucilaginibacter myungsuensis]